MRSTQALSHPALGSPVPGRRPTVRTLLTALRARLRAPRLDRQLSSGTVSWRSSVHAARSLQLTSDRRRRSLARSIDRLIEAAEQPRALFPGAAVPPRPGQVRTAKAMLVSIASRLRSAAPVDARGVAYLRELLCNGDSPFYARAPAGALAAELHTVSDMLDVPE
jgi:hypothetical protein